MFVQVDSKRNYWLIRTESGAYFEDFKYKNYIAIGWNEIDDLKLISDAETKKEKKLELFNRVRELYKDEDRPGYPANQIRKFVNNINVGDIVLIPSQSSRYLAFGIVESDTYLQFKEIDELEDGECPFSKRRNIKWLKEIHKKELDPYLFQLLNSRHPITKANLYADFIDRTLYSFYVKDDTAHLILRVKRKTKISLPEMVNFLSKNIGIIEKFNEVTNSDIDINDLGIKINVQSPGPVDISGKIKNVFVLGICLAFLVGGGFTIKAKNIELNVQTDGLIEKIIQFQDHMHTNEMDRKILEESVKQSIKELEAELPKELLQEMEYK